MAFVDETDAIARMGEGARPRAGARKCARNMAAQQRFHGGLVSGVFGGKVHRHELAALAHQEVVVGQCSLAAAGTAEQIGAADPVLRIATDAGHQRLQFRAEHEEILELRGFDLGGHWHADHIGFRHRHHACRQLLRHGLRIRGQDQAHALQSIAAGAAVQPGAEFRKLVAANGDDQHGGRAAFACRDDAVGQRIEPRRFDEQAQHIAGAQRRLRQLVVGQHVAALAFPDGRMQRLQSARFTAQRAGAERGQRGRRRNAFDIRVPFRAETKHGKPSDGACRKARPNVCRCTVTYR